MYFKKLNTYREKEHIIDVYVVTGYKKQPAAVRHNIFAHLSHNVLIKKIFFNEYIKFYIFYLKLEFFNVYF